MAIDPIEALNEAIDSSTIVYRKGDIITDKQVGRVHVTEVYAYPQTPARDAVVDLQFINVGATDDPVTADEFRALIAAAVGTGPYPVSADDLRGGPSYIALGGWLGSQEYALRYIALGELLGMWKAITPAALGITDPEMAGQMAGMGFVMAAPYDVDEPVAS